MDENDVKLYDWLWAVDSKPYPPYPLVLLQFSISNTFAYSLFCDDGVISWSCWRLILTIFKQNFPSDRKNLRKLVAYKVESHRALFAGALSCVLQIHLIWYGAKKIHKSPTYIYSKKWARVLNAVLICWCFIEIYWAEIVWHDFNKYQIFTNCFS